MQSERDISDNQFKFWSVFAVLKVDNREFFFWNVPFLSLEVSDGKLVKNTNILPKSFSFAQKRLEEIDRHQARDASRGIGAHLQCRVWLNKCQIQNFKFL